ncbi:ABC transporter permease [Halomicroarcula sp. GCM10025324]|uniref:ABC transporter permease n=1 Tax=Haloarcula TaxID=2237 RepID=UPI0023E78C94|nr:ABC transporter permease [Halomicroarcula sp. ZS-22-S1]
MALLSPRTISNLRRELSASLIAKIGLLLVALILLIAVFAPLIAPYNPSVQETSRAQLPPIGMTLSDSSTQLVDGEITEVESTRRGTWAHPLGTDGLGRDMLSRAIYGARTSLLVGFTAMLISTLVGSAVGLTAGYYGGRVDDAMMRGVDVILAFPSLIVSLSLIGVFGNVAIQIPDPIVLLGFAEGMPRTAVLPATITIAIASTGWVWIARIARGEAISVANEDYVRAARTTGLSDARTIIRHVLPNSMTAIIVLATIQIATIIIIESSLSFLGFSGTTLSWGFDIAQGRDYLATSWWIATVPGVMIVLAVIGINLIGDWLRDALDPGIDRGGANS